METKARKIIKGRHGTGDGISLVDVLIVQPQGDIDKLQSLIASAPELLEACKHAKREVYEAINDRESCLSAVWHRLEQAIAKATN